METHSINDTPSRFRHLPFWTSGRVIANSENSKNRFELGWSLFKKSLGLTYSENPSEGGRTLFFQVPGVTLWASVELQGRFPREEREWSLRFFDGKLWWRVGAPSSSWSSSTPRWKDGSFRVFPDKVKLSEKVLEERDVLIPMPEKHYPAHAKLTEVVWGSKWSFKPEVFTRVEFNFPEETFIPIPGKGESGYDLDDDGIFGFSTQAGSIEDGIGVLVGNAMKTRKERGGPAVWPANR